MIRSRRTALALSLVLSSGGVLAACGGTDTLSAAELRSKADAICTSVRADTKAIPAPASVAEAGPATDKLIAINVKGIADVKALKAPKADLEVITRMTGQLDAANVELVKTAAALKAGDETAANASGEAYSAKLTEFAQTAKAAGFLACGEGADTVATSVETTVAPQTTLPPETTAASAPASPFDFVNLDEKLNPIPGYTMAALPEGANQALLSTLSASQDVVDLASTVGTSQVTEGDQQAILIFLGLKRELAASEVDQFVKGVAAGATDVEQLTVAGKDGWAWTDGDGRTVFVTVRGDTAVLGMSDSTDHLSGVVAGLFESNPQL